MLSSLPPETKGTKDLLNKWKHCCSGFVSFSFCMVFCEQPNMSDPHAEFLKQYKQVFHLVGSQVVVRMWYCCENEKCMCNVNWVCNFECRYMYKIWTLAPPHRELSSFPFSSYFRYILLCIHYNYSRESIRVGCFKTTLTRNVWEKYTDVYLETSPSFQGSNMFFRISSKVIKEKTHPTIQLQLSHRHPPCLCGIKTTIWNTCLQHHLQTITIQLWGQIQGLTDSTLTTGMMLQAPREVRWPKWIHHVTQD